MKLYIAAVQLSRITPLPGGGGYTSTRTMTLHYRRGVSEDEMRGIAVVEALKMKQGFSIDEVLITHAEIPDSTNDTPTQG